MSFDISGENESSNDNFYPTENDINNLNQLDYKISKTELNDKEKDNFIENAIKSINFIYTKINIILNDKNIKKYPILNLDNNIDNNIDSHIDFMKKIDSNVKTIKTYQDETIDELFCSRLCKVLNRGKPVFDSSFWDDEFNDEAYHHGQKENNEKSFVNKKKYYLSCLSKVKKKILCLVDDFINVKNSLKEFKFNKTDFDSRGDFLIPNLNNITKRGKENYYPPYGWIGVGLNVLNKYKENEDDINGYWLDKKYKNSKWANAYLGFYQDKNPKIKLKENIKIYLYELVTKNENLEIYEKEVNFRDSNHWINRLKKGIYLNSKIEKVEKDAASVIINQKKFKILLMVRVKIDEIAKPENQDCWVLDKKFIRIYRILFKEIINDSDK